MKRPDLVKREAEERWQMILGLISLVVWFAVSFALILAMDAILGPGRPSRIIVAGTIAALAAAAPWIPYQRLVQRDVQRGR